MAFTGLRREGKTTLMFRIASDFIVSGFDSKNIIYFSFDDFRDVHVSEVIRVYEELMGKNFKEGRHLLLLDEIQKLENWEDQVKRIYDIHGKHVKIILSGSESLFLRKKSKETLSGRIFEFKVDTISFKEFLRFRDTEFQPVDLYERELAGLFQQYIQTQGFPELAGIEDREIILKYIRESIIEKKVYRDISHLFKADRFQLFDVPAGIFSGKEAVQFLDQREKDRKEVEEILSCTAA
ncbi:MAG TPA: AAA family ATPase [Candidatus Nanoarchaeia archaeon]|nr:AAA family ATPase [Candidatus Nanoarchaeia archaeon]